MRLLHDLAEIHPTFDDPNLVSRAGLVLVMALAQRVGLAGLVEEHVRIAQPCGVNAQVKVPAIVAGMTDGADSINGLDLLRHGALPTPFGRIWAPSTLRVLPTLVQLGDVLQLGKVHRLLLAELAQLAPLLPGKQTLAFIDIDSPAKARLRTPEAGHRIRAYQDPGQEPACPRAERAGRHDQHPVPLEYSIE